MINLGLTPAEYDKFRSTLANNHAMRVRVSVLNRDEQIISSLTAPAQRVISGAVQVDDTSEISRSLSLELLDPGHQLRFDSVNPAAGSLYADNFIRVLRGTLVPGVGWVDVPVFWGPVTGFSRSGHTVSIEAQGKETLALDPHFVGTAYRLNKGTRLDTAIRQVFDRLGETRYSLPDMGHRLGKTLNIAAHFEPWKVLIGGNEDSDGDNIPGLLARANVRRYAFYNGRGRLAVRAVSNDIRFVFYENRILSASPQLDYDALQARNRVVVVGAKPKGAKKKARGHADLPPSHPLSAWALRRNGHPRRMIHWAEAPNLRTDAACRERAQAILNTLDDQDVAASFECLTIPHLEEGDRVALVTDEGQWVTFRLRQFTIPLTVGDLMSVGFLKMVSPVGGRLGTVSVSSDEATAAFRGEEAEEEGPKKKTKKKPKVSKKPKKKKKKPPKKDAKKPGAKKAKAKAKPKKKGKKKP